jgi:hypothetical protein
MYKVEKNLGWEFIPREKVKVIYDGGINHSITLNDDGFRDIPFTNKTGGNKIMVLGDSFVSNISVKDSTVFTQKMEDNLNDTSVYNLGVNGYGQVQEYLLLKKWLPKIQPDLIIVLIYLRNDFGDNVGKFSWLYPRPTVEFTYDDKMHINQPDFTSFKVKKTPHFFYNLHLYRLVQRGLTKIKSKLISAKQDPFIPPELSICRSPLLEDTEEMYLTTQKLIGEIHQYATNNNTPIVFALAPSLLQVEDDKWSQLQLEDSGLELQRDLPNQRLKAFASANTIQMIDLMPALIQAHRNGAILYNSQEQHWTAQGNQVVADVLVEYIRGGKEF